MSFDISKLSPEQRKLIPAEMLAAYEKLQADNKQLAEQKASRITFKVSQKGAFSVYGLGRLPVTLYSTGWRMLHEQMKALMAFVDANDANATKQSELYEKLRDEATAKGLKDTKVERYVVEALIAAKNPYVSESTLKFLN